MPAIFSCPDDGGPPLAAAPIPKLIEIELGIELLGEPRLDSLVQFARRKGRAGASQEVIGQNRFLYFGLLSRIEQVEEHAGVVV